jgi:hypothetical protein
MLPIQTLDPISPVGHALHIRCRKIIRLGPERIDIRSNEPDFKGFRFFSASSDPQSPDPNGAEPAHRQRVPGRLQGIGAS